jgi:hypothetical protein
MYKVTLDDLVVVWPPLLCLRYSAIIIVSVSGTFSIVRTSVPTSDIMSFKIFLFFILGLESKRTVAATPL